MNATVIGVRDMGRLSVVMLFFSVVFCASMMPKAYCVASDNELIAVGDGFKLTIDDVGLIKEFYDKTSIRTTEEEYQKAALKINLFAKEATALELDKDVEVPSGGKRSAEYLVKLQAAYVKYVMESYPVSDLAIESYFRSYPDRFAPDAESIPGMIMAPMDAEVKAKVRTVIVNAKNRRIVAEAEDRLKAKYHVKLIETQGEN